MKRRLVDELNLSTSGNLGSKKLKTTPKIVESTSTVKDGNPSGKKNKHSTNIRSKLKSKRLEKEDNNNNAVPFIDSKQNNLKNCSRSRPLNRKRKVSQIKLVPIIQTRGMKQKLKQVQDFDEQLKNLNAIDKHTSDEILGGEDVEHDGIELSIHGSDEEFTEDFDGNQEKATNDELDYSDYSDEEDSQPQHTVSSKVVKVSKKDKNSRSDKFDNLRQDPEFKQFLIDTQDERDRSSVTKRTESGTEKGKHQHHKHRSRSKSKQQGMEKDITGSLDESYDGSDQLFDIENGQICDDEQNGLEAEKNKKLTRQNQNPVRLIKSPSDMTIYTPALRKADNEDVKLIEKISNFVESIRLDDRRHRSGSGDKRDGHGRRNTMEGSSQSQSIEREDVRQVEHAHRNRSGHSRDRDTGHRHSSELSKSPVQAEQGDQIADQLLVQGEKFKARIEAPKGNYMNMTMPYDYDQLRSKFVKPEGLAPIDSEILFLRNFDQDGEFFHVTSQIEPNLRGKIECGEFIELERLLPRERSFGRNGHDDLNRQLYQLITQGTSNYLEPPVPKNGKISNVRKWDQAFRVFAAIYTQANPEGASEIWQYVYVIHTAAAANPWENVYFYDINFRELMVSKPWRSWGKTYTQGWNTAFNNSSSSFINGGSSGNGYSNNNAKQNFTPTNGGGWKDNCCWRYNKNRCKRSNAECNYDHRCTYCSGWNHGFHNCRKRIGRNKKSFGGSGGTGSQNSTSSTTMSGSNSTQS